MIFSWLGLHALHRIDLTRERKHLRYSSWRPWAPRQQASANILALPRRFPAHEWNQGFPTELKRTRWPNFTSMQIITVSCCLVRSNTEGFKVSVEGWVAVHWLKSLCLKKSFPAIAKKHTILCWTIIQRCHKKNNRYNVTRLEKLERAFLHLRLAIMHRMEWDRLMHMSPLDLSPLALDILYPLVCFDFIAIPRVNSLNGTS